MMILFELFYTFFKIGLFTFGGGYAMIRLIQDEVLNKNWMTPDLLVNFIGVSESTPGPFAINIATFVGTEMSGILGSAMATLGVVLPSFIIIIFVAKFYLQFKSNRYIASAMTGLRPTAIALILSAVVSMAITVFIPAGFDWSKFVPYDFCVSLVIMGVMLVLVLRFKKFHPVALIGASAVLGIAAGYAEKLFVR